MFTGLVTDVGEVVARAGGALALRTRYDGNTIPAGASIACDGCCLTVKKIETKPEELGSIFWADVSNETLSKTTIGTWTPGRRVNLERALQMGDELGGHLVAGHIDGLARIIDIQPDGESRRFTIETPDELARFIAPKGSVALDGISLTVNEVAGARFGVNVIPLTLTATTWGGKKPGDLVNIEVDTIARYVARQLEFPS